MLATELTPCSTSTTLPFFRTFPGRLHFRLHLPPSRILTNSAAHTVAGTRGGVNRLAEQGLLDETYLPVYHALGPTRTRLPPAPSAQRELRTALIGDGKDVLAGERHKALDPLASDGGYS